MRHSQQSSDINKSRSRSKSKSLSSSHAQNKFYFCHYRNAMYMGGMKSFQRNGYGVIIHDNGSSIFCSHYNDFKHGHNIVYNENSIMSLIYDKNKVIQSVIRLSEYLLFVRYNKQGQIDGKGLLFDYSKRQIVYLFYKKGVLVNRKQQEQYSVINRVFQLQNLQFLIGIPHSKALRYQIQDNEVVSTQKTNNKLSVGFFKRGSLNGLGFTFIFRQPGINQQSSQNEEIFYFKPLQRGYFHNSQLTGMGQKWFKNGNNYFGDFKDNIFDGKGILKNTTKNNWVYGTFCKGNMSQLIEYSNEGDVSKFKKLIQMMHERKSTWINKQILTQNPQTFLKQIEKIVKEKGPSNLKTLQERKKQVLRKIQQNFICDDASSHHFIPNDNFTSGEKTRSPQNITQSIQSQRNMQKSYESQENQDTVKVQDHPKPKKAVQQRVYQIKDEETNEPKTVYKIKLLQIAKTREKNGQKSDFSVSPNKSEKGKANQASRLRLSQKSMGYSQIKDESPSFKLDSKRLIGRSRLFKYTQNQQQQDPPKFNYVPAK